MKTGKILLLSFTGYFSR